MLECTVTLGDLQADAKDTQEKAEAEKKKKQAEVEAKRSANVAAIEKGRAKPQKSNPYSKKDVKSHYATFCQYDKSGDGYVSLAEYTLALTQQKEMSGPSAGMKSTAAQRQSAQMISIADLADSTFKV